MNELRVKIRENIKKGDMVCLNNEGNLVKINNKYLAQFVALRYLRKDRNATISFSNDTKDFELLPINAIRNLFHSTTTIQMNILGGFFAIIFWILGVIWLTEKIGYWAALVILVVLYIFGFKVERK